MMTTTRRATALAAGVLLAALQHNVVRAADGGFAKGADISWITEMEAAGRPFLSRDGKRQDLLVTLKEQGMDAVRLRVWVDPADAEHILLGVNPEPLGRGPYLPVWADGVEIPAAEPDGGGRYALLVEAQEQRLENISQLSGNSASTSKLSSGSTS